MLTRLFLVGLFLGHKAECQLHLTIGHMNDIHAHFEENNEYPGRCNELQAAEGNCYGGTSRLFNAVQELNSTKENFMLLNAGDYYAGTIWYTIFHYEPMIEFSNMLNYTAMAFGNHEFDDGIDGLKPFVENVNFPLLSSNLKETPDGDSTVLTSNNTKKSVVVEVDGVQIGIIGYVTRQTPLFSFPDSTLEFLDEVESVRSEAKRLKGQGVEIIIALGHAGYR